MNSHKHEAKLGELVVIGARTACGKSSLRDMGATYAQDTATIARLRDENLAKLRRIEHMRLELLKLEMQLQRGGIAGMIGDESELVMRLETIRGEPA